MCRRDAHQPRFRGSGGLLLSEIVNDHGCIVNADGAGALVLASLRDLLLDTVAETLQPFSQALLRLLPGTANLGHASQ